MVTNDSEDVVLAHNQGVLTVDLDLGAPVFGDEDFVAVLTVNSIFLAGLQHLKNVSSYKLGTYKSAKTLWHYIFAQSSA